MWKVVQILTAACVAAVLLQPDHYRVIGHEFYQVWDTIEELKEKIEELRAGR